MAETKVARTAKRTAARVSLMGLPMEKHRRRGRNVKLQLRQIASAVHQTSKELQIPKDRGKLIEPNLSEHKVTLRLPEFGAIQVRSPAFNAEHHFNFP